MELICKITDEDIGEEIKQTEIKEVRIAARGIVMREDGKIGIFNKANKNEYKLPGGGIEEKETPEEAFKREVLEETGCEVEIIKNMGITEEYKTKNNFKQISYVFVGKVLKDTGKLHGGSACCPHRRHFEQVPEECYSGWRCVHHGYLPWHFEQSVWGA